MAENEKLTEMSNQEIDQAIMATQEEIQDKIKTEIPLIGERIPLNSLSDDFSGDDLFLEKLNHLTEIYKDIIKIRNGLLVIFSAHIYGFYGENFRRPYKAGW